MPIKIRKTLLKEPIIFDTIGNHWEQEKTVRPNGFPLYHYLQSEKGCGKIEIQKKEYILNEGEGVLIAPFISHSYEALTDNWLTMFATFTGIVESSIPQMLGNRGIIFISKEKAVPISDLIFDMINRYENPSINAKEFSIDSYRLLMNFVDDAYAYKNNPLYQKYVEPVEKEIIMHYNEELTVQYLSNLVYVSPQYLSRLFKQFFGCSVYKYLTNYRINKSKEYLLIEPKIEIQHIAQLVGFFDTSHFIAMFKKNTGITPLDFRKLN